MQRYNCLCHGKDKFLFLVQILLRGYAAKAQKYYEINSGKSNLVSSRAQDETEEKHI